MCSTALSSIKKRMKIMKPQKEKIKYSVPPPDVRPKVVEMKVEKPKLVDSKLYQS